MFDANRSESPFLHVVRVGTFVTDRYPHTITIFLTTLAGYFCGIFTCFCQNIIEIYGKSSIKDFYQEQQVFLNVVLQSFFFFFYTPFSNYIKNCTM